MTDIMNGKKKNLMYLLVLAGYIGFVAVSYWTLLSGNNLMKYDIWDAEYPNQVLMTDAIAGGTLPLWNPLMNMGMPFYASIGTPVWYPLTLILACIGYNTPWMVSIEYLLHLVIGAYGAFLLVKNHLQENGHAGVWMASFLGGLIYCSSGLFISNAEHIMIIISAAWIPYVFYFVKRFLQEKRIEMAMASGFCAGMILLGGYPEMFYDLFLLLVPLVLAWNWNRNFAGWKMIANSAAKYLLVCFFTVLAGAITLLPFLKLMPYMTRSADVIQSAASPPLKYLLSFFLPRTDQIFRDFEPSMGNYYISLLVLLASPYFLRKKQRYKIPYMVMAFYSLILSLGTNMFLFGIFQKYLPMYATFRFPSVSRSFLALFLILLAAPGWKEMFHKKVKVSSLVLAGGMACLGGLGLFVCRMYTNGKLQAIPGVNNVSAFHSGAKLLFLIAGAYFVGLLFLCLIKNRKTGGWVKAAIVALVSVELFCFIRSELPFIVTQYGVEAAANNKKVKKQVRQQYLDNKNRNRSIDFSEAQRTNSGLGSSFIVFEKTFDDEGYLSVRLSSAEYYKQTYHHSITESNPEIYFTSDIVDGDESSLEDYLARPDVSPLQIFIEAPSIGGKEKAVLDPKSVEEIPVEQIIDNNMVKLTGAFETRRTEARLLKFYVAEEKDVCKAIVDFTDENGTVFSVQGDYTVYTDESGDYIKVYFPNSNVNYISVQAVFENTVSDVEALYTERMKVAPGVKVNYFSFNDIDVDVDASQAGYLTILQSNYPGWRVYVDNHEAEIETVNGNFIGVPLEAGSHHVVLRFRPVIFYIGTSVSVLYVLAMIIFLLYEKARLKGI